MQISEWYEISRKLLFIFQVKNLLHFRIKSEVMNPKHKLKMHSLEMQTQDGGAISLLT